MLPAVWPGVVTIWRSNTRSPSATAVSARGTVIPAMSSAPAYPVASAARSRTAAALPAWSPWLWVRTTGRPPAQSRPMPERRLDRVLAPADAGVDDRRLAAADEDVRGDEAEVDAGPGGGAGPGTPARGGGGRRLGARARRSQAMRRRSPRGSWTGRRCRSRPGRSPRCPTTARAKLPRPRSTTNVGDRGFGTGSRHASSDASTTGTGSHDALATPRCRQESDDLSRPTCGWACEPDWRLAGEPRPPPRGSLRP